MGESGREAGRASGSAPIGGTDEVREGGRLPGGELADKPAAGCVTV